MGWVGARLIRLKKKRKGKRVMITLNMSIFATTTKSGGGGAFFHYALWHLQCISFVHASHFYMYLIIFSFFSFFVTPRIDLVTQSPIQRFIKYQSVNLIKISCSDTLSLYLFVQLILLKINTCIN